MVGRVFLTEGIQKFLFPLALGAGRFAKIGLPHPALFGPFVGALEIGCGSLLLFGLFTRCATIPLLIDMCVAITVTKLPLLHKEGVWRFFHEARVDWCMLLGGFLDGVNVASLALMAQVSWFLGRAALTDGWTIGLALLSLLLLLRFRVQATWLLLGGALVGLLAR
jgi:hypothetical protein